MGRFGIPALKYALNRIAVKLRTFPVFSRISYRELIMGIQRIAACGVDCSVCSQYKVTVDKNYDAALTLVEWYRSMNWITEDEGAEAIIKKAPLCNGCWEVTGDCFFKCGCGSRDFRICCKNKNIEHCGECDIFPCEHYKIWVGWSDSHKKAMEYLLSLRTGKRNC